MLAILLIALTWVQAQALRHGNYSELKFGGIRQVASHRAYHLTVDEPGPAPAREGRAERGYGYDWDEFDTYRPPEPGNIYKNTGFVKTDGRSLVLNGQPWQFAGTNAFYAGLEYIMSEDELRHMMKEQENVGTSVMRVFTSSFERVPNSMMPEFGVVSESSLRRLDLLLLEAAKRNIRIILVLSNYWPFLGDMQTWVDMAYPNDGRPLETFYTDEFLKDEYKWFVSQILKRRNTYTGILYKDDPSIFSYELANEPRTSKGYDRSIGRRPGATICDWVAEMSSFVRSIDSNHLLTVGDEGMRADLTPSRDENHGWLNNGHEGVDFTCNLQYADVATVHLYPDSWSFGPGEFPWLGPNYLKDRRDVAWSMDKPVILEEYGMRRGYLAERSQLFGWVHEQIKDLGYAGSLVWAVSHEPVEEYQYGYYGYNDGQGYVFGLSGKDTDGVVSIVNHNKYVRSLIDPEVPCTDIPPGGPYSCLEQQKWGKCAESGGFMDPGTCDWSCGRCGGAKRTVGGDGGSQASAQLSELIPADVPPQGARIVDDPPPVDDPATVGDDARVSRAPPRHALAGWLAAFLAAAVEINW